MIISQITLAQNNAGLYKVKIKHDGKVVQSRWHKKAPEAYSLAECQLIYKPGYVQTVPRSEYL